LIVPHAVDARGGGRCGRRCKCRCEQQQGGAEHRIAVRRIERGGARCRRFEPGKRRKRRRTALKQEEDP